MHFTLLFWIILLLLTTVFAGLLVLIQRRRKEYPTHAYKTYSFHQPYKHEHIAYTVFLVGDMGALSTHKKDPVAHLLELQLKQAGDNSSIIFLGDNIYPR